ncbi:MAG: hypothetical protein ABJQ71_12875 [Roseibium sp.]
MAVSSEHSKETAKTNLSSSVSLEEITANASSHANDEAVILSVPEKSLLQDANELSQQMRESNRLEVPIAPSQAEISKTFEEAERRMKMAAAQSSIKLNKSILSFENERIGFLENVEPAAPRVLLGDEAKDTLQMLETFEIGDVIMGISETGRKSWEVEGLIYALEPNGTLTVGEAGVPTTQEERLLWLNSARERFNISTEGLSRAQEALAALEQERHDFLA